MTLWSGAVGIRRWRRFTHWVLRYKHKRQLWHWHGKYVNMIKDRREGNVLDNFWEGVPPGRVPANEIEETFPNARRHIDRSEPRPKSEQPQANIMTRHRILGGDEGTYLYRHARRH